MKLVQCFKINSKYSCNFSPLATTVLTFLLVCPTMQSTVGGAWRKPWKLAVVKTN